MSPHWWAPALTVAERLPAPGSRDPSDGRVVERLRVWRSAHDDRLPGWFDGRLADLEMDEAGLAALLAEDPRALAARVDRPLWADLPDMPVTSAVGYPGWPAWRTALASVVEPFVAAGVARLSATGPIPAGPREPVPHPALLPVADGVLGEFRAELALLLVRQAARTLVTELHRYRRARRLDGATPVDRYDAFIRQVRRPADLTRLLTEYPVLTRLLAQTADLAGAAHGELLRRFVADRPDIVADLCGGVDPGQLVSVSVGEGDRHRGGRSVAILLFADGRRLVYRPRSGSLQRHFDEMLRWFNGRVAGVSLRVPRLLARPTYSWAEYVAEAPCADAAGVRRFYYRTGALLALLHAVNATDMHCGNLVAAGDGPVLVDVETLFQPAIGGLRWASSSADPAEAAIRRSVLRTALVPFLALGDGGALDMSGLGGDAGHPYPTDAAAWDDAGTDEMRLVRRPALFGGAANRPRLGGRPVDPAEYRVSLLDGFRAGYDAIRRHRDELLAPDGPVARCARDETRVLLRHTRHYATLLDESTHPRLLRDALDRQRVLDVLWAESPPDPIVGRLVRAELLDLWRGDIPLFTGRPDSRDVWTADGERVPDALECTGLDAVARTVGGFDPADRRRQEWLIGASLAARVGMRPVGTVRVGTRSTDPAARCRHPSDPPSPDRLLVLATRAADRIAADAHRDGGHANWIALRPVTGPHWVVVPSGFDLGHGSGGVAVFLAQLARVTGAGRHAELARDALRAAPAVVKLVMGEPGWRAAVGTGAFSGLAGLAYALARVARLLDDDDLGACAADVVAIVRSDLDALLDVSVADGLAGVVAAMLAVGRDLGLDAADGVARMAADRLAGLVVKNLAGSGSGFATGFAGVRWALRRYADAVGDRSFADVAATHPVEQPATVDGPGWADGWAGVLAASAACRAPGADLDGHLRALRGTVGCRRELSLATGLLGVLDALEVAAATGYPAARAEVRRVAACLDTGRRDPVLNCGTPGSVRTPGLLVGLAGIGFGLLRLARPEQVPSPLFLDPAR